MHCPGFISSHYDPRALSPPRPLPRPCRHRLTPSSPSSLPSSLSHHPRRRLLTLNFLSCITALRLSSRVKKIYKWKDCQGEREKGERERENDPAKEKGCFVKFVDLPRPSTLVRRLLPPAGPPAADFFLQQTRKHDRRDRSQDALRCRRRNAECRRKFTFVMARNKYLFGRTLFQLFI